jgi:hypothetical protein
MSVATKSKRIGGEVPSNGAAAVISASEPYTVGVRLVGTSDLLFHRWNAESVDERSRAAKNSKAKKTDDIESYVYRDSDRNICVPGEYLRMAVIFAAKFKQDPRSPRKSAMDLYKAGIVSLTPLASLGKDTWDYEDKRRVVIQRNGVNRVRPAMREGWSAEFSLMVLLPEYIDEHQLHDTIGMAGRLVGLGDFRPTYGRFRIDEFERC